MHQRISNKQAFRESHSLSPAAVLLKTSYAFTKNYEAGDLLYFQTSEDTAFVLKVEFESDLQRDYELPSWTAQVKDGDISYQHAEISNLGQAEHIRASKHILIKKLVDQAWFPTSFGLAMDGKRDKPSPMRYMNFDLAIANAIKDIAVCKGSIFAAFMPISKRYILFRVDRVDSLDSEDETGVFRMTQDVTKVSILSPIQRTCIPNGIPEAYEEQMADLSNLIDSTLNHSPLHDKLKIPAIRAIMVQGPGGTGKTHLIRQTLASRIPFPHFVLHVDDIIRTELMADRTNRPSESLAPLRRCFEQARLSAPSIIMLEGLDLLSSDFGPTVVEASEIAAQVAAQIAELTSNLRVCIVASTRNIGKLPRALQLKPSASGGGFDRIIELGMPTRAQRKLIVQNVTDAIARGNQNSRCDLGSLLDQRTAGFSARDIRDCICQACQTACSRNSQEIVIEQLPHEMSQLSLHERNHLVGTKTRTIPSLSSADTLDAVNSIRPSHEGFESVKPDVSWDAMGGYPDIKKKLLRLVTWPLEQPEAFAKAGVPPPAGILLYGPSGCGKTMLVRALASSTPMNFIAVKGSQIYSKYLGESEATIRRLFASARQLAPCLVFLDELDNVGTRRDWSDEGGSGVNERILSTLLNEMDGVSERTGVLVIACTGRPHQIDDALLRPGRLDHHICIPLPSLLDRRMILESITRLNDDASLLDQEVDLDEIAKITDGFTGADLRTLIRESGIQALRQSTGATSIGLDHILSALKGSIRARDSQMAEEFALASLAEDDSLGDFPSRELGWWAPASIDAATISKFEQFNKRASKS
ncbi:P-loop containing nucleoside triphosphate hydrolase protein [Phlyctochytrium arcticum]|nr:P-loop containing nucleoside triphosphate hydrolase protein [Phlyctochytrium arcticum]